MTSVFAAFNWSFCLCSTLSLFGSWKPSFSLPRFLILYFFLTMLPTSPPLCVLLLILAVLFRIGIPTRLTSGRKGVNQGHGLIWQESCPFMVLVLSLLGSPEEECKMVGCTVSVRKQHQNKYAQLYGVCFVFVPLRWKSKRHWAGWVHWQWKGKVSRGVSHAFGEEQQTRNLWLEELLLLRIKPQFVGQLWFQPHSSVLIHQDAV